MVLTHHHQRSCTSTGTAPQHDPTSVSHFPEDVGETGHLAWEKWSCYAAGSPMPFIARLCCSCLVLPWIGGSQGSKNGSRIFHHKCMYSLWYANWPTTNYHKWCTYRVWNCFVSFQICHLTNIFASMVCIPRQCYFRFTSYAGIYLFALNCIIENIQHLPKPWQEALPQNQQVE